MPTTPREQLLRALASRYADQAGKSVKAGAPSAGPLRPTGKPPGPRRCPLFEDDRPWDSNIDVERVQQTLPNPDGDDVCLVSETWTVKKWAKFRWKSDWVVVSAPNAKHVTAVRIRSPRWGELRNDQ